MRIETDDNTCFIVCMICCTILIGMLLTCVVVATVKGYENDKVALQNGYSQTQIPGTTSTFWVKK